MILSMIFGLILNVLPSTAYFIFKQPPNNDKERSSVIGINQQSSTSKNIRAVKEKGFMVIIKNENLMLNFNM